MSGDEQRLTGGLDHAGEVVRIGGAVHRPRSDRWPLIHGFLAHLEEEGFDGAPRVLGVDQHGREVLTFLEGDVAPEPDLPGWVADPTLLETVARLQRDLQRAARGFTVAAEHAPIARRPRGDLAAYDGHLMCHQDFCESNVVVRDGQAVAVIDFDHAAPCDPVLDIAIAAHHWVPLCDPADLDPARSHLAEADLLERFARFCDQHALLAEQRVRVVNAHRTWATAIIPGMRRRAESGHPGFARIWADGFEARTRRTIDWVSRHAHTLAAAQ